MEFMINGKKQARAGLPAIQRYARTHSPVVKAVVTDFGSSALCGVLFDDGTTATFSARSAVVMLRWFKTRRSWGKPIVDQHGGSWELWYDADLRTEVLKMRAREQRVN